MDGIGKLEPSEFDDQTVLPRHVKRALDYMNGNLAEKITPFAELVDERAAAAQCRHSVLPAGSADAPR